MDKNTTRRVLSEIYKFHSIASGDRLDSLGGNAFAGDVALEIYMSRMHSERRRKMRKRISVSAKKGKDVNSILNLDASGS